MNNGGSPAAANLSDPVRTDHCGCEPNAANNASAFYQPAMRTVAEITRRLRFTLRKKGRSFDEAEDLVQDAMLKYEIYRQTRHVDDPESFITRTAFNLLIDSERRRGRSPILSGSAGQWDAVDPVPGPEDVLAARRNFERLRAGLEAMNPISRDILLSQRLDGLTYAQIAKREGISESAVEKRLARAIQFLQEWMEGW